MKNKSIQDPESMSENTPENPSQKTRQNSITRFVSEAEAKAARQQLKIAKDGSVRILRFTRLERLFHFLVLVSITGLAYTGLAQISIGSSIGRLMQGVLGGLENTQSVHHAFAILLAVMVVYHFLVSLDKLIVRRQKLAMFPGLIDLKSFIRMQLVNLGLSKKLPRFDRYSYEEKAIYWLFVLGILLLGLTGLIQWFPLQVTEFLPGIVIPSAGIIHRWEAILIIFVIFVWHLYRVLYRKRDFSIFTGLVSRQEMQLEHALELEYLEKAAAAVGSLTWPVEIELSLVEDDSDPDHVIKDTSS
jgi:cytochrome b subunit of formate dehydrogenase